MKTKEFKVDDEVFDPRYGWGRVLLDDFTDDYMNYPIHVIFHKGKSRAYTKDGKDNKADINPILSHTEYPTQSEYPKVMEVSDCGMEWYKRVVFAEKNGKFIAWLNAKNFKEAKYETSTHVWDYAREIQEPREISLQEIADKFGIPVEEVRIKK